MQTLLNLYLTVQCVNLPSISSALNNLQEEPWPKPYQRKLRNQNFNRTSRQKRYGRNSLPGGGARRVVRTAVWRGDGLCGAARRADRGRVDSHRRALDQHPAGVRTPAFWRTISSRRPDRRVSRVAGGVIFTLAGTDLPGISAGVYFWRIFPSGAARWLAGRAVHDPAAAPVDREGAWQPALSRRHGLR